MKALMKCLDTKGREKSKHKKVESRTGTRLNLQFHVFSPKIMANDFSVAAAVTF